MPHVPCILTLSIWRKRSLISLSVSPASGSSPEPASLAVNWAGQSASLVQLGAGACTEWRGGHQVVRNYVVSGASQLGCAGSVHRGDPGFRSQIRPSARGPVKRVMLKNAPTRSRQVRLHRKPGQRGRDARRKGD